MRPIYFRPRPHRGSNNNPVKTQEIDLYLARRDVALPEIRDHDAAQVCDNALMVNAVGEWNDETEAKAGISLICSICYESARVLNQSTETGQEQQSEQ
jgi:hypothetical protein